MATQRIDGKLFEQMVRNGLNNIIANEKKVNDMNVFPVPDGDTGTNMRLTLANGVNKAFTTDILSNYVKDLSAGMLLGARGNSGVILSQIFKGLCTELDGLDSMNTADFLRALVCGYKTAYAAVINPVEGTVLTVAREGTEYVSHLLFANTSFETMLELYLQGMRQSLKRTPELLPMLMQAGVEDSGALGFIIVAEGMYKYLCGEIIEVENLEESINSETAVDFDLFKSDSKFEFGYCMEFLLRLMDSKTDITHFDFDAFTNKIKTIGESVVSVRDGSIVKVHIHVFKPAEVIAFAQQYGEFLTFKLENMCLQHNETVEQKSKKNVHVPLAVIAVGNGDGIGKTLSAFKHVIYIDGGSTMNTSTEEFVEAINMANADKIIIMPNNKNVVKSARQAVEISKKNNVEVVESSDVIQCFYALSMDMPEDNIESRVEALIQSCKEIKTLSVFKSVRTCTIDEVECKEGEYACAVGPSLVASNSDFISVLKSGIQSIEGYQDCEMCFAFTGKNFRFENDVNTLFADEFPDLNLQLIPGGQEHRDLILGLV